MCKDKSLFEIILKAKEGDKDAMQEIILRFQPLIKKNMRNVGMDIKDDISQDIIEVIIKAIKKFDIK
ncbi:helix-turn-helix domain-containing protein [Thermoanaerobacterium thermosaccharolyticum]|jgi:RNA polymerase sporulation-specific sigma factor|uniref:helix-turn-helix domain-containing protein n=1 Tax=Thermoanaerobacterium thermosaccharolyticum TaxID=1517 RepID=UPI00177E2A53|nr:helix-turn-helix domain-containing protein [Thermoanaerobacterium thermosaccharolyticum]MBE0068722.1 helix-turn-helix domain-containing protein [Thermoanaerobacterium thermosaccharolyticum]MBE0228310.1 helix-turn-helix domain-containing protein [Thermoanaerobacterium thermosaccharolyticum]